MLCMNAECKKPFREISFKLASPRVLIRLNRPITNVHIKILHTISVLTLKNVLLFSIWNGTRLTDFTNYQTASLCSQANSRLSMDELFCFSLTPFHKLFPQFEYKVPWITPIKLIMGSFPPLNDIHNFWSLHFIKYFLVLWWLSKSEVPSFIHENSLKNRNHVLVLQRWCNLGCRRHILWLISTGFLYTWTERIDYAYSSVHILKSVLIPQANFSYFKML